MNDNDLWTQLESDAQSVSLPVATKPKPLSNTLESKKKNRKSMLALDSLMGKIHDESLQSLYEDEEIDSNSHSNPKSIVNSNNFDRSLSKNNISEKNKVGKNERLITRVSRMEELMSKLDAAAKVKKQRPVSVFYTMKPQKYEA